MISLPLPFRSLFVVSLSTLLLPATNALAQAPGTAPQQAASAPQSTSIAKQEPVPSSTVLHTGADLVLVDVVVTDHGGNPIPGLDKSRFHILEDGHEQAITSFDEHTPSAQTPGASPTPLPPNTFTNIPAYPDTQTVNVLLLDGLNTLLPDQMRVRQQMLQYMSNIKPGTPLAIFTLSSRLRMIKGFTTNPAELVKVLASSKAHPANLRSCSTRKPATESSTQRSETSQLWVSTATVRWPTCSSSLPT